MKTSPRAIQMMGLGETIITLDPDYPEQMIGGTINVSTQNAVVDPREPWSAPANDIAPDWCNWAPFADFFDVCQPKSEAQLEAEHYQDLAKIRAVNPALADAAMQRAREITAIDRAAGRTSHWDAATNCPLIYKTAPHLAIALGCSEGGQDPDLRTGTASVLTILALGVGMFALVMSLRR
jgi:hypothetical protein